MICSVLLLAMALLGVLWVGIVTVYVTTFVCGFLTAWWTRK
jgi:hypothetical protein